MKKSYLTLKRILLAQANAYLEKGDIIVYDTVVKANNLTIYRGGDLIKTITHSQVGMAALVHANILEELTGAAPPTAKPAILSLPVKPLKSAKTVKVPAPAIVREAQGLPNVLREAQVSSEVWALPYGS